LLDQHCLALQDLILVGQQHRRTQCLNEWRSNGDSPEGKGIGDRNTGMNKSKFLELLGKLKNTEGVTFHAGISR
jgi:hypothetical protein